MKWLISGAMGIVALGMFAAYIKQNKTGWENIASDVEDMDLSGKDKKGE